MKQYSSPRGGGSPPSVSEAWKRSACGRTHRRRHEPCRRPWRGNGKAMRRRPGPANPMACSGPGNATADGSSKISAVRFRAESSCGRFDDTAAVPSGRSASPDYRSNPHGGTMTRRTSMRKAPADPLPENANRRHAPLKRRRRWFRMVGGPDRPILLDPPPGDRRTPVAAHDGCRPMPIQGVGRILQKPGPSYARTCESPYAGVDIPHRRDIRRGDSTDSVTSHSCAGGRRYHEDANHVNHHAREHDVNYLEHRRQHKDALWEQLREPHQAPHREHTDKAADGIADTGHVRIVHNS